MQLHTFVALQLLVSSVLAKPIARHQLARHRIQSPKFINTSIPVMTPTSIGSPTATSDSTVDCIVRQAVNFGQTDQYACQHHFIADCITDDRCGSVADSYNIRLSAFESDRLAHSDECKSLLLGYRICIHPNSDSTSVPLFTSGALASNTTLAPLILTTGIVATITPVSDSTLVIEATAAPSAVERLRTTTLTYTIGVGASTTVRTVVATRTETELVTFLTTVAATLNPYSETTSTSSSSSTTLAFSVTNFPLSSTTSSSSSLSTSSTNTSVPSLSVTSSSVVLPSVSSLSVSTLTSTSSTSTSSSISSSSSSSTSSSSVAATSTSVSTSASSSACAQTATAPAPTQSGIVSGCTEWYTAVSGDFCSSVAADYGISVDTFMAWNPAVDPPNCPNMLVGDAYCVATCNGGVASTTISASSTTSTATGTTSTLAATATSAGEDVYVTYTGDGSIAAGWPAQSEWVDFDSMFAANTANMKASCAQWGVPLNTDAEVADMKSAITVTAASSGVDARFILATVMQESTGCVRVITTQYSHFNPGLMQSNNGTGSCNTNQAFLTASSTGIVQTPCPSSEITQMIEDGTTGTASGDGLEQLLVQQGHTDVSRWYRAARLYNGGSIDPSGDLGKGCCTLCYASDIANRLTGWVNAASTCSL